MQFIVTVIENLNSCFFLSIQNRLFPIYERTVRTRAYSSCSTTAPIPSHHVVLQGGSPAEAKSSCRKKEAHCRYKVLDEERENALFYSYQIINVENMGRNTLVPLSIMWRSLYQFLQSTYSVNVCVNICCTDLCPGLI